MNAYQDGNNSGFNSLYAQASANQEMARRELEKKEKRRRKISMAIGVSVVLLPVLILSSIAFFNSSSGIEQGTSSDYQQEITENPNVQEAYTAQVDTLTSDLGTIVHKETPAPISEEFALPGDEISQFEKDLRKIYGQNKIAARVNPNSSILSKKSRILFHSRSGKENLSTSHARLFAHVYVTEQYKEDIYNNTADYFDRIMADKEHAGTSRPVHFISIRQKKGKYYLTYSNVAHGQLVGFAERFTKLEEAQKYLKSALLPLRETEDPMVFFSADNSKATDSVIAFLDKQNITFYMRNEHITKNFFTASNDLLGLQENVFDSASVAFINGIPQTSEETATQGYSQIDHGKLSECSQYFSSALKGSKLVMGKDAAIGELTAGTSDVVLLIAHADKLEIYMGGEKISMEELEKLKGEPGRKRPRTAYLFSCNTGDLDKTIGIFTKTHVASLSEILLKNDMVDVVVAPKHEIAVMEAKEVLNDLLKGKTTKDIRSNYKGWRQIAQLFKPKPSGKENINA